MQLQLRLFLPFGFLMCVCELYTGLQIMSSVCQLWYCSRWHMLTRCGKNSVWLKSYWRRIVTEATHNGCEGCERIRKLQAERKPGREKQRRSNFAFTLRAWEEGEFCILYATSSKIGSFRKYCDSAGAHIGATYCPLSPLMNGIGSVPNPDQLTVLCVCILCADMRMDRTHLSLKRLPCTIFYCSVPSSDTVFPWRSEATFHGWPLAILGPRQGQRGSNAGIVLLAQHAFSLWHSAPKGPSFLWADFTDGLHLYLPVCARDLRYYSGPCMHENVVTMRWICGTDSCYLGSCTLLF